MGKQHSYWPRSVGPAVKEIIFQPEKTYKIDGYIDLSFFFFIFLELNKYGIRKKANMIERYLDFRDRRQQSTDWFRSLFLFPKEEFPLRTIRVGPIVLRALFILILLPNRQFP